MKVFRKSFVIVILLLVVVFATPRKIDAKTNMSVVDEYLPQAMSVFEKWNVSSDWDYSTPAVVDLDGDGTLEVLTGTLDGYLLCLSHTGVEEWNFFTGFHSIVSAPAVVDIDRDGDQEILFTSNETRIYCLDHEGNEVWGYTDGTFFSNLVIADLDKGWYYGNCFRFN